MDKSLTINPQIRELLAVISPIFAARRRGRPKAWERRVADWSLAVRLAVPILGAWVLAERGKLTWEQVVAVALYVGSRGEEIDPIEALPVAGDRWVLAAALERMGVDPALARAVGMNEITLLAAHLAQVWAQASQHKSKQKAEAELALLRNLWEIAQGGKK